MEDETYYFAYGSNMNEQRMINRKVYFAERQVAKLTNYRFKINVALENQFGAANIEETSDGNDCVHGVLYTIKVKGLSTLDIYEDVDNGMYERRLVTLKLSDGKFVEATTYVGLKTDDTIRKVCKGYLEHILRGRDVLPNEYSDWLEKTFNDWCIDTPCWE